MPDYIIEVAAGVRQMGFPSDEDIVQSIDAIYSIVAQKNTSPVIAQIHHEPPAVYLNVISHSAL